MAGRFTRGETMGTLDGNVNRGPRASDAPSENVKARERESESDALRKRGRERKVRSSPRPDEGVIPET